MAVAGQSSAVRWVERVHVPGRLDVQAAAVMALGVGDAAAPVLVEQLAVRVLDLVYSFFPRFWWVNSSGWNEERGLWQLSLDCVKALLSQQLIYVLNWFISRYLLDLVLESFEGLNHLGRVSSISANIITKLFKLEFNYAVTSDYLL